MSSLTTSYDPVPLQLAGTVKSPVNGLYLMLQNVESPLAVPDQVSLGSAATGISIYGKDMDSEHHTPTISNGSNSLCPTCSLFGSSRHQVARLLVYKTISCMRPNQKSVTVQTINLVSNTNVQTTHKSRVKSDSKRESS